MDDNSKYIELFIEETQEQIMSINQILLQLETVGYDKDLIRQIYGIVHTIKGTAGVLGIGSISNLAHAIEDLFDIFQQKEKVLDRTIIDLLFKSLDLIEYMVKELKEDNAITSDGKEIIEQLKLINEKESEVFSYGTKKDKKIKKSKKKELKEITLGPDQKEIVMEALASNKNVFELDILLDEKIRFKVGRVFQLQKKISSFGRVIALTPDFDSIEDSVNDIKLLFATEVDMEDLAENTIGITGVKIIDINPLKLANNDQFNDHDNLNKGEKTFNSKNLKNESKITKSETIRIKSRLLDQLLDLVSEIMISNIRINQIASELKHHNLQHILKNNERLIGELQDTVLDMRLVPVDHIFRRFPRMVRDIAKGENKNVDFQITGHDIEIDRCLLDGIGDVLVHLLRNAVNHGIEPEKERVAKDKNPMGIITLSAYQEQSSIIIEVEDDGRGMDFEKIIDKALKSGVISKSEAESLSEKDAFQLAFLPGISTAKQVSDISGRGVGLDAVKSKIESVGGSIKFKTKKNLGTKFTIKLPPTMSIISAMLVEINDEKYAIPLENVCETMKLPITEIHEVAKSGMFKLREEILPIHNIHTEFGGVLTGKENDLPVIIVEKAETRAGLIVTKFIGQQEIVVKSLNNDLKSAQFFSGATILGDGNVAMIVDVNSLIN